MSEQQEEEALYDHIIAARAHRYSAIEIASILEVRRLNRSLERIERALNPPRITFIAVPTAVRPRT